MKRILLIFSLLIAFAWGSRAYAEADKAVSEVKAELAVTEDAAKQEEPTLKETIFEHLGDAYGWEVPFNHHKRIPLPIIVVASDGVHVFSSSRLEHGAVYTDGDVTFKIATEGDYKGKVVEITPDGKEIKPWDISITKNVCAIFIACIIVLACCMMLARWHRKNPYKLRVRAWVLSRHWSISSM